MTSSSKNTYHHPLEQIRTIPLQNALYELKQVRSKTKENNLQKQQRNDRDSLKALHTKKMTILGADTRNFF